MPQTYPYQPSPFKGQTYALQQLASYLKRQAPTVNQFHWDVTFTKPFPVQKAARNVGSVLGTLEKGQLVYQTWEAQPVWLYLEGGWNPAIDKEDAWTDYISSNDWEKFIQSVQDAHDANVSCSSLLLTLHNRNVLQDVPYARG
jgi:hypothetical protein